MGRLVEPLVARFPQSHKAAYSRRFSPYLDGAPGGARALERECGNKEQWLRHLARHPPRMSRGERREREERRAYPGPRQRIRVMTLGLMMGCLKSESGKWGRAGVQRTRRHGRIDAQRHGRIYSGHPRPTFITNRK